MKLLLDTHILLLWLDDNQAVSDKIRNMIQSRDNLIFVSAASIWEISIKSALGILKTRVDIAEVLQTNGFQSIPITTSHAQRAGNLPPGNGDTFNRVLVAQALEEGLSIITRDSQIEQYHVDIIRC